MRKIVAGIILSLIVYGCTKDDFCLENPVTPNLILRFYDDANRNNNKNIESLYVWADGKDSIFENITTDSLVIPLNTNTNQTVYNLSSGNTIEQLTVNYTPENIYVSRSCGFKVIFNQVSFSPNNNWILDYTANTTTIENQNEAHVQIFH